jgi:hypothetical protein
VAWVPKDTNEMLFEIQIHVQPSSFATIFNPPLLPSSIDNSNLPLLIDQRVALNYELAISNTLEGVGDLYNIYDSGGLKNGQHLIPNLRSRKHIDDLALGGYLNYWQRN